MEARDGTLAPAAAATTMISTAPTTRSNDDLHHNHEETSSPFHDDENEQGHSAGTPNNNHHYHHSYHSLYNHELDPGKNKPLVVEVAEQLKEKLTIKNSSHPINGCVLGRENGLTKLDRLEESLQPSVHGGSVTTTNNNNNRQASPAISLSNALPDIDDDDDSCLVVNCEKRDLAKGDAYPRVHSGLKRDANVADSSSSSSSSSAVPTTCAPSSPPDEGITYVGYESELQMPDIMRLIQKDLSEPYSIYTYRYFIHNWPKLCFLAMDGEKCVGAVVCKLDLHKNILRRGYIAMLAVDEKYRKRKIGSNLVLKAIRAMVADDADEVVLETEITNKPALRLYENLGFVRDKRLFRYYLNGVDALRLKLWLR